MTWFLLRAFCVYGCTAEWMLMWIEKQSLVMSDNFCMCCLSVLHDLVGDDRINMIMSMFIISHWVLDTRCSLHGGLMGFRLLRIPKYFLGSTLLPIYWNYYLMHFRVESNVVINWISNLKVINFHIYDALFCIFMQ
jgi:hypothetical protein